MPYAPYGRGPVYMAVAGLVAVIALVAGIVMLADHKSSRGAIFVVAAVVAVIVAVFARPRLTHMAILRPRWSLFA